MSMAAGEYVSNFIIQYCRPSAAQAKMKAMDSAIILEGEIWAVMDEGETLMRAGDVLIQRGTNHAWANRSARTARIAFVLIDGSS